MFAREDFINKVFIGEDGRPDPRDRAGRQRDQQPLGTATTPDGAASSSQPAADDLVEQTLNVRAKVRSVSNFF